MLVIVPVFFPLVPSGKHLSFSAFLDILNQASDRNMKNPGKNIVRNHNGFLSAEWVLPTRLFFSIVQSNLTLRPFNLI